ncbi:uncharacterized protein RAG0_08388 [Rhynchosporium agropyri]|uniref:Uncharacterized protein n=1 Tax=Rhynchosporium agropyri TaxID=914238 RepID=A0A1E1KQM5_9HELO|nr:uncharacterized protein RAG0_08388 [Rhynchosporium agropyri]
MGRREYIDKPLAMVVGVASLAKEWLVEVEAVTAVKLNEPSEPFSREEECQYVRRISRDQSQRRMLSSQFEPRDEGDDYADTSI